jgi:hypothetical protein
MRSGTLQNEAAVELADRIVSRFSAERPAFAKCGAMPHLRLVVMAEVGKAMRGGDGRNGCNGRRELCGRQ